MNEAELLFSDILGCDRVSLYLNKDTIIDKGHALSIASALKRRLRHEPVQYILGKSEFMGLELKVNQDVLIPRPETEVLVETALRLSSGINRKENASIRILDLCTGSGCIAVSLASLIVGSEVTASDISRPALEVAEFNAVKQNVKIDFILSDLFSGIALREYDLITSNPPYVSSAEFISLEPELMYEPRIALDAGEDGISFYRRIITASGKYLKKNGFLIMEMGYNQSDRISELVGQSGCLCIKEIVRDYAGIERVMVVEKNG